jgi:hypothetical protein
MIVLVNDLILAAAVLYVLAGLRYRKTLTYKEAMCSEEYSRIARRDIKSGLRDKYDLYILLAPLLIAACCVRLPGDGEIWSYSCR